MKKLNTTMTRKERKIYKAFVDNCMFKIGLSNFILHERITSRNDFPLSAKFFFKQRLKLDYKLRQEYRGLH